MNLYLRALKNTQICVTGRAPLTFTVNGCETLQAYREQLFDEVAAALEYCILLTQDRVANAGKIRMLEVHLKHIRNHIFLDKEFTWRRTGGASLCRMMPCAKPWRTTLANSWNR